MQSCCCPVSKSHLTLCNPMNCSTPGFPVLHSLPEFVQNPCPPSQWCHATISSSAVPFSSWNQLYSVFFMVQLSHPYLTMGKTRALTIWTFVGKVMSLLFNTQSRFFTAFLPRSKCLLISWLQSLQWFWSPRKENLSLSIYFYFFPSVCHEVMGPDAIILVFWM